MRPMAILDGGIIVAKIYEISEIRARQIKLAKLKEILGEQMHRVVIPLIDIPEEELDYILPALLTRPIDDLTIGELDDLLNGNKKFFVLR
jgi:hypothetical protein